jgi:hypothetical protein
MLTNLILYLSSMLDKLFKTIDKNNAHKKPLKQVIKDTFAGVNY